MIPNLLWTALFLIPITLFCYNFVNPKMTYILLGVSLIPVFFPNSFFDSIQLSKNSQWYIRIGVKHINSFAQHGSLINKFLRQKYPNFKSISKTKASIQKQYYQTYFYEKFHFSLFLFFTIMTIYAGIQGHFDWVLILTISNLLYNVYPNLLQQYIRVKLKSAKTDKKISRM
jgi:glycosyl-4,4'-diaponeurosporenoate acyltransferase